MGEVITETSKFQRLIDSIEKLSLDERELLIEIIRHHLNMKRRSELVAEVAEACKAYKKGEFKQGDSGRFDEGYARMRTLVWTESFRRAFKRVLNAIRSFRLKFNIRWIYLLKIHFIHYYIVIN